MRHEIPSQEQRNRSLRRIKAIEMQATQLSGIIEESEKSLLQKKEELQQRFAVLENDCYLQYVAAKTVLTERLSRERAELDKASAEETKDVRSQLLEVQRYLETEQAYVASIRKLPDEMYLEIFQLYLEGDVPPRQLALVCKKWKALLLASPSLWRKIEASFVHPHDLELVKIRLSKRIKLSRATALDVTLNTINYSPGWRSDTDLFKMVAQTGLKRWRSLTLRAIDDRASQIDLLEEIQNEDFAGLRILHCHGSMQQFQSIIQRIVKSKPIIEDFHSDSKHLPSNLSDLTIFRHVKNLAAWPGVISQLGPLANLHHINLLHGWSVTKDINLPPFPQTATISHLMRSLISVYNLRHVRILVIGSMDGIEFEGTV